MCVWLGDGVQRWPACIGDCVTRGLNAVIGYFFECMARVVV